MTNGKSLDISTIIVLSDAIVVVKAALMFCTAIAVENLEFFSDIMTDDDVEKSDTLLLWVRQQSKKFDDYVCYSKELFDAKVIDYLASACKASGYLTADKVMRCDEMILARLSQLSRDQSEDYGSSRQESNEDDVVVSTLVPSPTALEDATDVSEQAGDEAPLPRTSCAFCCY